MSADMTIFQGLSKELKPYIKSIWHSNSSPDGEGNKPLKLLPMTHMDLVLIKKGKTKLIIGDIVIHPSKAMFQGLQTNVIEITNVDKVQVFGISFTPWGLYPFINQSIYSILEASSGYKDMGLSFIESLLKAIDSADTIDKAFESIDKVSIQHLQISKAYEAAVPILKKFTTSDTISINDFCELNHVHKRKLERDFKKYIGVSPRDYQRIKQLVMATDLILRNKDQSLTEIGHSSEYYDQSHFIRNFKRVLHDTPQEFIKKDQALKSKIIKK